RRPPRPARLAGPAARLDRRAGLTGAPPARPRLAVGRRRAALDARLVAAVGVRRGADALPPGPGFPLHRGRVSDALRRRRPGAGPGPAAGGIEKSHRAPILYRGRAGPRPARGLRGGSLMSNPGHPTTLALLVGGGPAPGINGVISATTIEAVNQGLKVYGVR